MSAEVFEQNRSRLLGIAYGMLGSVMDAEDVVQEAYLRWRGVDAVGIDSPTAYLTTVVTRLAIDRLRSAQMRRETYVGPWVPEPLIGPLEPDPADVIAEAESLSLTMLTALERLNPVERAVLLLREVFDYDYVEIADIVDKSPANCRQIAARARERAGDASRTRTDPAVEMRIVEHYVDAVRSGDAQRLAEVFSQDVVLWSDGGGKARAARHLIYGAERVARHLVGVTRSVADHVDVAVVRANGDIALVGVEDGVTTAVLAFEIRDDQVTAIRAILNPDKLERVPGSLG